MHHVNADGLKVTSAKVEDDALSASAAAEVGTN